jgi:hypothetical protein
VNFVIFFFVNFVFIFLTTKGTKKTQRTQKNPNKNFLTSLFLALDSYLFIDLKKHADKNQLRIMNYDFGNTKSL